MAAIEFTTKGIADIPAKQQINDADKLLVYEDGKAKSMTYKDVVEPIKNDVKDTFDYTLDKRVVADYMLMRRTGKKYQTKIWKSSVNPTPQCEKLGINAELVCEPSTDTVEGRDDYADIPLFQWVRCNYDCDSVGHKYPIAIEGGPNYQTTGTADVGSLRMTKYYSFVDHGDYYILTVSDSPFEGSTPQKEAIDENGVVQPYVIFSCYFDSLGDDGASYSQPNKPARLWSSYRNTHNERLTKPGHAGAGIGRQMDWLLNLYIKYATKNSQSIMSGCTGYSMQATPSVKSAEESNDIILTNSQADGLTIGGAVILGHPGTGASPLDRGQAAMRSVSATARVAAIEVYDDTHKKVTLDHCEPFATTDGESGPLYITTWPWYAGSTDCVIDRHDGSMASNVDGKHPCRVQGVEHSIGCYFVPSDVVCINGGNADEGIYSRTLYEWPAGTAWTENENAIKTTYTKKVTLPLSENYADQWIGDVTIDGNIFYQSGYISSSAQGMCDRLYYGGNAISGARELLFSGYLTHRSHGGLSFLNVGNGLAYAVWSVGGAD